MISVSKKLRDACNGDKITYREYVVLNGTTTPIDVKTEMYASAYKDSHFIGTFNMKYIKFTTSNDIQYRNKELTLYKEINGENFKVGNFIVTEIKDNDSEEEVTVTAYDYGLKFANPYTSELDYESGNVTLLQVLRECCNKCGVKLLNQSITNGDFIVDSNQFVNGEQCGDVISAIAFMSGTFATINNKDQLEFIFYKRTSGETEENLATQSKDFILTEDGYYLAIEDLDYIEDYVELEDKRDTQPITSVKLGFTDVEGGAVRKDEELIKKYGEHWLIINDCPLAYSTEKQEQLIDAIFNKVKGFGYSAFTSKYAFKPYYALGDLIKFRNKNGDLIQSIILRIETKYDDITLSAPSVTNATIDYDMPETIQEQVKRANLKIDQANSKIEAQAEEISLVSSKKVGKDEIISSINISPENVKLNSNRIDLDANDVLNLLAGNSINLSSKNITINSNNFSVDANGNMVCNSATANDLIVNNGAFTLRAADQIPVLKVINQNDANSYTQLSPYALIKAYGGKEIFRIDPGAILISTTQNDTRCSIVGGQISLQPHGGTYNILLSGDTGNIRCVSLTQTSLEENKKNFEKYSGALDEIGKIDIYKYNLKNEKNTDKKHLGFVIGDKYNYSSEITSIDEEGKEIGVDNYSMTSLCLQAIKEQQEIINDLKSRIEVLENEKNNY